MEEVKKITGTKEFEEISRKKIQEYYKKEGIELDKEAQCQEWGYKNPLTRLVALFS